MYSPSVPDSARKKDKKRRKKSVRVNKKVENEKKEECDTEKEKKRERRKKSVFFRKHNAHTKMTMPILTVTLNRSLQAELPAIRTYTTKNQQNFPTFFCSKHKNDKIKVREEKKGERGWSRKTNWKKKGKVRCLAYKRDAKKFRTKCLQTVFVVWLKLKDREKKLKFARKCEKKNLKRKRGRRRKKERGRQKTFVELEMNMKKKHTDKKPPAEIKKQQKTIE